MTRAEIERRLNRHILCVAIAGMAAGASKREADIAAAKELLLDEVEAIVREDVAVVVRKIGKSVQRA